MGNLTTSPQAIALWGWFPDYPDVINVLNNVDYAGGTFNGDLSAGDILLEVEIDTGDYQVVVDAVTS